MKKSELKKRAFLLAMIDEQRRQIKVNADALAASKPALAEELRKLGAEYDEPAKEPARGEVSLNDLIHDHGMLQGALKILYHG